MDLEDVARLRFDAVEVGDPEAVISAENAIFGQEPSVRQYRIRLIAKRREILRSRVLHLVEEVDAAIAELAEAFAPPVEDSKRVPRESLAPLIGFIDELDVILGSTPRPPRWTDLRRHLYFGLALDVQDIRRLDWPEIKPALVAAMYGEDDPLPVSVSDLSELEAVPPTEAITMGLDWPVLTDETFERLIFRLISDTPGYENVQWLQKTRAADRGRDLSAWRIEKDPLSGVRRRRVIIQCKHWLSKSVGDTDVADTMTKIKHWEPPRIDALVIATSGRFTADAISYIERHNQEDHALEVDMWPDSHLEELLASKPALTAAFAPRHTP